MRTLYPFIIGATLGVAIPTSAFAQRQGAIEVGGFGRATWFADTLKLDTGLGLGGRAGIYAFKNWLLEMELSYADVDVNLAPSGNPGRDSLNTVSHALWAYRLTYNHPLSERVKLLAGAGYAYDAYGRVRTVAPRGGGPQGLLGPRFLINDRQVAPRGCLACASSSTTASRRASKAPGRTCCRPTTTRNRWHAPPPSTLARRRG